MAKFERFEEIEAWKKARTLTSDLYRMADESRFARCQFLRDQLLRASVSIMANIAEGFGRGGDKEFRHFLAMAIGSSREVQNHLYVALDVHLIDEEQFRCFYALTDEIARLIGGLMRYLGASALTGRKYCAENRD